MLLVLGCVAAPGVARAQALETPRPRQGYYLSLGLQGAVTRIWDEGDAQALMTGSSLSLRVGELLTEQLGLGLLLDFGGSSQGTFSSGFGGLAVEGQWTPLENLALRGAVGLAVLSLSDSARPDEPTEAAFGAGYTLALSYDWFFSRKALSGGWSVVPLIALRYIPSDPLDGFVGFLGLEVSYWGGLPSNQLELPAGEGYKP